jgi:hypothetical protein
MKKKRIPMSGGGEHDVFTNGKQFYIYLSKSGICKKIKKGYNKRFRKVGKQEIDRPEK